MNDKTLAKWIRADQHYTDDIQQIVDALVALLREAEGALLTHRYDGCHGCEGAEIRRRMRARLRTVLGEGE